MRDRPATPEARRLLWRSLALFVVVLFVPLVLGGVLFATQADRIQQDVLDANRLSLELNKNAIEEAFRDINGFVSGLRQEQSFSDTLVLQAPVPRNRILDIAEAYSNSLISRLDDPYILEVMVYFNSPQILFTKDDVFLEPSRYYGTFYSEPNISYEQWQTRIGSAEYITQETKTTTVVYRGSRREAIELRFSLPLYSRRTSLGTIVALIDRSRIERLLEEMLVSDSGFATILALDGSVLAYAGSERFPAPPDRVATAQILPRVASQEPTTFSVVIDGVPMVVSHVQSEYNHWSYISSVPRDLFLERARRVQSLFLAIGLTAIAVGVPLAAFFAYGSTRPIVQLSEVLRDGVVLSESDGRDAMRIISDSVSELISRNSSLRGLLDEQKPLVRGVVVERLFKGDFSSEEEVRAFLDHFDVRVGGDCFGVACIFVDGYYDEVNEDILKEFLVKNTLVREQLGKLLADDALIHEIGLNRIAVVLGLSVANLDDCSEEFSRILRRVSSEVNSQESLRCLIAAGGVVSRLMDVAEALSTAIETLNTATPQSPEQGVVAAASSSSLAAFYYPPELETRIINQTVAGRAQEVEKLAAVLIEENLESRSLSVRMLQSLASEIEGTRLRIYSRLALDSEAGAGQEHDGSIEETIRALLTSLVELAARVGEPDARRHRYHKPIADYVHQNYRDRDMSLKKLALEFSLSEVYLSTLFKEMMGANFHGYLEDLRMQDALTLLDTTNNTVEHVAADVGYSSTHVFRRAFKRRYGVSPSNARSVIEASADRRRRESE